MIKKVLQGGGFWVMDSKSSPLATLSHRLPASGRRKTAAPPPRVRAVPTVAVCDGYGEADGLGWSTRSAWRLSRGEVHLELPPDRRRAERMQGPLNQLRERLLSELPAAGIKLA